MAEFALQEILPFRQHGGVLEIELKVKLVLHNLIARIEKISEIRAMLERISLFEVGYDK